MSRGAIFAGKAAILVTLQDNIDRGLVMIRNKLNRFANSAGAAGSQALRGGILGSIGSGFMLKQFSDFSDEMLNLQTKLGYFGIMTQQQRANLGALEKTIRDLGKSTSYTSKEVAAAAVELAQAGFNVREIQDSLQATLDLARGAGYGISDTASLLANTVRTFNLSTTQTENVASMMVRATRLGTIGIEDMRESLKYLAGTAYNLEQSLPTVLGMLVQLSETGLKGSLGGTSPNVAMLNIIANLEKLQGHVAGFNLATTTQGTFDFIGSLKQLFAVTRQMSAIEKTALFQEIFNIRGARAISGMQEIEQLESFINQIQTAGKEARLASTTMDSGLGGATRRATSAFDDLGKTIGKIVSPAFEGLLEAAAPLAGVIDNLARRFPALVLGITALPFALVGAGVALLTFSFTARKVAGIVQTLLGLFRGLGNVAVMGTIQQMGMLGFTRRGRRGGTTSLGQLRGAGRATISGISSFASGVVARAPGAMSAAQQYALLRRRRALELSMAEGFERRAAYAGSRAQYARTMAGAARARGVASPQEIARMEARRQRWLSRATAARANAGALRHSATGGTHFNLMRQILGGGRASGAVARGLGAFRNGLIGLTRGFLMLSRGVLRFTLSFSGVWTIFEMLLLFGNRIPIVAKGMERLGAGFTRAFGEITKIGALATGPLKLLFASIGALVQGEGKNAELGFRGIVIALSDMGTIIWNQIVAGWYQVVAAVAPFYDVLRKIIGSLYEVISLTIGMAASFAGGRMTSLMQMLSGGGPGADWNSFFKNIVQQLGWVIGSAFGLADKLASIFDQFIYDFQIMMINLLNSIPVFGLSNAQAHRMRTEATAIKGAQDVAHTQRKIDRQAMFEKFWDDVEVMFRTSTQKAAEKGWARATGASGDAAQNSWNALAQLTEAQKVFLKNQMAQQMQMQAAGGAAAQKSAAQAVQQQMQIQRGVAQTIVGSLVGYAHETRGQLLKKGVTEAELLERIAKASEETQEDIEDLAGRAGPLTFRK